MSEVTRSVEINVPLTTAYRRLNRFEEYPRLVDGVREVIRIDARHHRWRIGPAGAEREFRTEVVERVPRRLISWRAVGGDSEYKGAMRLQRVDRHRCWVEVSLRIAPSGLTERAADALGFYGRGLRDVLRNVKESLESGNR